MTYTYDTWGNITEKKIYAYTTATNPGTPTSTIPYVYGNSTWKDQLTKYNGQTISYDSMGNPTTYRGKTLTWKGKELTGVTGTASYTYDMNGLRTAKTVSGTTTNYFYNNTVLMGLTSGSNKLLFSYDAKGLVQAVNFNGTYYYYLRNGQGDIVKIIDGTGAAKVEYSYDSWGKKLSCTGTLATTLGKLNPFRYRGYVYDEETGFYYLKSRYYDPETCRFISADVLLSTGQGVIGNNTYVYCRNNPINAFDEFGHRASELEMISTKGGGGNTPQKPPKAIVFTIPEFEQESAIFIHKWMGCSWAEVQIVSFSSEEDFINAWNRLCNPTVPVIINAHGSPYSFGFEAKSIIGLSNISKLNTGKMRSLVLLCCNNGQIDVARNNIANAFASLTGVRVYASDSEVFNWFYLSQGWYVYDGGNGHHTKVSNRVLNWGDI